MYRDKDLTEETEEIILKRLRNQIEQQEFNLESLRLQQEREATLDLPRRDQSMIDGVRKQTLTWQKSHLSLPLELNQKKLTLEKQQIERAKTEEKFQDLENDRAAMTVRAPMDGIVYHGQADRGQWNTATVTSRLRRNGAIQPKEIFMTVVSLKPVSLRADAEERDLHTLKEGLTGQAVPVAFPSMKIPCRIKRVSMVPRAAGSFETSVALDVPDNVETIVPGMIVNAKFVTYRNDAAVVIPTSAIFRDEGSDVSYVYLSGNGKPARTEIEIGKVSGNKTEIVKGLKAGAEILASKP
jgi:multidrug efflux pump subunit AcrA (membrane-fusion protein)